MAMLEGTSPVSTRIESSFASLVVWKMWILKLLEERMDVDRDEMIQALNMQSSIPQWKYDTLQSES